MSCPDCFNGHVHPGSPQGYITTLRGLNVYVAEPASATGVRGIIVIIPDAFGWEFVNCRLLADRFAEKGRYRVYLPDFMGGHAMPTWLMNSFRRLKKWDTLSDWFLKPYDLACILVKVPPFLLFTRFTKTWPTVQSFFTALRSNEGLHLPIASVGYCWGGKHTVTLSHGYNVDGRPLIDAGFTGHPSFLTIPDDIVRIRVPVSFALGQLDVLNSGRKAEYLKAIMADKEEEGLGEVRVYEGAGHGFCVREDTVLGDAERQATEAEEQALTWFEGHLSRVSY
ncbi:hypothetical protein ASPWEDRAFT_34416 [Aspergillus wentii DTO 134E9]|uniref:Dienelactone hydrolase domain-containing protein n=1 Tax=Aspergillus wentii DTO 134E9 TaxID=1073089 RepID=A0A1L9S1D8_ASPWE|nr:uncharacterized protein ASPWEDRAFT_34416 [Aspergillus wentii DTO 134E9]KAI9931048.1 hypothetical protein MW887_010703 [Aspergillus wentii]OJJ40958.1 hypothetical protein ASPWEDRAFT_34416 [Aspergillus wentii DTO 134E9]